MSLTLLQPQQVWTALCLHCGSGCYAIEDTISHSDPICFSNLILAHSQLAFAVRTGQILSIDLSLVLWKVFLVAMVLL